jgi:hypothetical protein
MNGEFRRFLKEVVMTFSRYCSSVYLEGQEKNMTGLKISGLWADI